MLIKPLRDSLFLSVFFSCLVATVTYLVMTSGVFVGDTDNTIKNVYLSGAIGIALSGIVLFLIILKIKNNQVALCKQIEANLVELARQKEELHVATRAMEIERANANQSNVRIINFSAAAKNSLAQSKENIERLQAYSEAMASSMRELNNKVNLYRAEVAVASDKIVEALKIADNMMAVNHKVNEALVMIPKITAQINLVALNATIEASRAGDVGKGFAVVATEVKKLAMETFEVTQNITDFLGEGNSAADQANGLVTGMASVMHDTKSMIEGTSGTVSEHLGNISEMLTAVQNLESNIDKFIEEVQNLDEKRHA